MSTLTAEQRIQRAHVRLMGHRSTMAFSSIFMVGESVVKDDVPTACTNGRDVMYGRGFVETLTDQELAGVVLHENLHKIYQHAWLWRSLWKENPKLANQSADYVINIEIKDLEKEHPGFIALPKSGLYRKDFRGMDTGEVYRRLKEEGEEGGEGGFDEHEFDQLSEEDKAQLGKEVEQAIRQGALMAGKMGGDESRVIGELTAPKIDWREQLQEFMSAVSQGHDDSTWRKPNRRWLGQDLYLPSSISESMGSLVIGIDTSGSVSGPMVSAFLSEVVGICQNVSPEVLHFVECDATIQSHKVFDQGSLDQLGAITELHGGGGTDMRVIFDHVVKNNLKPEAVIVLTDGYTSWPGELPCPTLWAITEKHIVAPVGTTIHLEI
jgi:predicted metal-dependent peptidase